MTVTCLGQKFRVGVCPLGGQRVKFGAGAGGLKRTLWGHNGAGMGARDGAMPAFGQRGQGRGRWWRHCGQMPAENQRDSWRTPCHIMGHCAAVP